jgi:AraC-like DNA-binding protein
VDPITDIFRTMHVLAVVHAKIEATAPWGLLHVPGDLETHAIGKTHSPLHLANFAMVARGNCWLLVESMPDPMPLTGGDFFFVAPGVIFSLRDDPRTPAVSFCGAAPLDGSNIIRYGGGGAPTEIISGLLAFEALNVKPITQLLPKLILIKSDQARTLALHTTMQMLAAEMAAPAPGSEVVVNRLAEVLFIQTMRAHISSGPEICKQGWLRAIFDPQIGSALKAIHQDVNKPWTLESLADAARMSRSAFAARFKELVVQTPLEYVTEWRMQKALPLLQADRKLIDVARSVGYESDAAFNKAFKRVLGITPGEYRRSNGDVKSMRSDSSAFAI